MLSIALPPMPSPGEDDDGERSAASSFVSSPDPASALGLTQLAASSGLPQLGAPIPPTPQAGANSFGLQRRPPMTPGTPSEPSTPVSVYPNTTSPQPSPLPSPASHGSRPSTPRLSPIMFRRFSSQASRASSTSGVSVATSAAADSPGRTSASMTAPSPSSAYSSAADEHATPESAQTATPTPASPTPAHASAGWARQPGTLSPAAHAQGAQSGPYAAAPVVAHFAPAAPRMPSVSEHGVPPYPPPSSPPQPVTPQSPPTSPPNSSPPPPAHAQHTNKHKLVRKSRSHAHAPSLSAAHQQHHLGLGADLAPPGLPPGAAAGPGQRSVSGPPLGQPGPGPAGRTSAEWAASTSSGRSSFDVAEAVVDDLRERERERDGRDRARGHKLRKEHRGASMSEGGSFGAGGPADRDRDKGEKHHRGRLARVLGLRK